MEHEKFYKPIDWNKIFERIKLVYQANTQQELGIALGVSQDLVSNWKTGKSVPTWVTIDQVIRETGVPWEWLMTGKSSDLWKLAEIYTDFKKGDEFFLNIARRLLCTAVDIKDNPYKYKLIEAANRLIFIALDSKNEELPNVLDIEPDAEEMDGYVEYLLSTKFTELLSDYDFDEEFTAGIDAYHDIIEAYNPIYKGRTIFDSIKTPPATADGESNTSVLNNDLVGDFFAVASRVTSFWKVIAHGDRYYAEDVIGVLQSLADGLAAKAAQDDNQMDAG